MPVGSGFRRGINKLMQDNFIIEYFVKGGWIMWPILFTSLTALAVVFERII